MTTPYRLLLSAALLLVPAIAFAGPPKPGKKCSVSAGSDAVAWEGFAVAGLVAVAAAARRTRRART
jgi:hypothetical protein